MWLLSLFINYRLYYCIAEAVAALKAWLQQACKIILDRLPMMGVCLCAAREGELQHLTFPNIIEGEMR